jgi:hypothetical protein
VRDEVVLIYVGLGEAINLDETSRRATRGLS